MSVKGNDSKKDAAVVKRAARGSGFMSGYVAQLMVFLNGLILTVTAFFTLNIFINQIVEEGMNSLAYEVRDSVGDRLGGLEKSLQTAASAVSFSWKLPARDIVDNFSTNFTYQNYYDQLYWLQWQESEKQYVPHRMLKKEGAQESYLDSLSPGLQMQLHKHVVQSLVSGDKNGPQLIPSFPGFKSMPAFASGNPVIMTRIIERADGHKDIIYGVSLLSKIMLPAFLSHKKNVQGLTVLSPDNAGPIYRYVRAPSGRHVQADTINIPSNVQLGGKAAIMALEVSYTERELFLKKIPLLMLLFGITLTLIGTMYVRNNQKQSQKLALMNIQLAGKNEEMNRQIQEREKLNHALQKQEKENRAVIDSVSDIIFETATDGQILFLNETWQKITGFSAERSLGRNIFDLLYTQDQMEQRNNMSLLVKGHKTAYRAFTRLRTSDGNFRAVELAVSMLRQDENREMRVVGTITDVEERRRAERALSEAEKKYRAIVENAAGGIYQVTPEGHYLSANPAMARILGYETPENILRDVRNANTEIYYNPRDRERHLRDALRHGSVDVECQIRCMDGKVVWVHENLRAVKDDQDQLLFYEGSMEDITQRRNVEIALREAKVQSDLANRSKSEFLANMSHELRTPLNAIIGFSDIIYKQAFGAVGRPEYTEYAHEINESGKHLLQVINDILDVSRIEAGDRQLNEGVVDMNKTVLAAIEMLAPKIDAQKIVMANLVTDVTPKLIGESHAIKQMLVNLLSNAVKFTPENGRVSIHAEVDGDGQMHVSVTDTGVGLTDEEIEKALSPFGQVNASFNKSESGTGLGLTLVQSLMSLHGGSFELFSQKGVGTTATLIFPPKRVAPVRERQPVDA